MNGDLTIDFEESLFEEFNQHPTIDRLIQFIRIEKPNFRPIIQRLHLAHVVAAIPRKLHARLSAQDGAFLVFGLFGYFEDHNFMDHMEVERIDVSLHKKEEIRRELAHIGIHNGTLFPEIDKTAEQIKHRYS